MSNKYSVIAIIGKSGSGKDTLLNKFFENFSRQNVLHKIISYTTRPPRENEVDGKDYFFVSKEEFAEKVLDFEMLEAAEFRDWHYGTGLKSLDKYCVNVGIFDPDRVGMLAENPNIDLYIIEVRASGKIRLMRQLNREDDPDVDEIVRRYQTDELDFYGFDLDSYIIFNETEDDLNVCVDFLKAVTNAAWADLPDPPNKKG